MTAVAVAVSVVAVRIPVAMIRMVVVMAGAVVVRGVHGSHIRPLAKQPSRYMITH
jgi:hypothetical protein